MASNTDFCLLDDDPIVIQKTLNQWAHLYTLVLHNPKYINKEVVDGSAYCAHMTVMVERTKKGTYE